MRADVAQASRAQKRIGDGVQQRIGIRMAQQTEVERDRYAAQNQRPTRDEGMNIPALANSGYFREWV